MSHVHSNYCLSFISPLPSKPTKHHPHPHLRFQLSLSSFSHTSLLSPPPFPRNSNTTFRASLENPLPHISVDQSGVLLSASEVVRNFYGGVNRHDLASVEPLIAPNCVYEDLVFPTPFVGRKSILEFFGKFIDYVSTDLQFVIDAISEEDLTAVGVTWHLEWKGRPFPFSKGCSFYQLGIVDGIRQIVDSKILQEKQIQRNLRSFYHKDMDNINIDFPGSVLRGAIKGVAHYARDSVEPAIKPGESALIAIRGVTWLLQRFPKLVEWM